MEIFDNFNFFVSLLWKVDKLPKFGIIWEQIWTNFKILLILFLYFKVEDKGQALTFHYRNVVSENRQPMIEKAEQKIIDAGFMVGLADCAIECKPTVNTFYSLIYYFYINHFSYYLLFQVAWDKGRASLSILRTAFGVDWAERIRIIYAGDDNTDEDAILALKGKQIYCSDEPEPSWLEPQLELKFFQLGSARLVSFLLQLGLIFFSSKIRKLPFFAAQRKKIGATKATYKKLLQYYVL